MRSIREIGLKITAAQREYFRYTGISADMERRGMGTSRPEFTEAHRQQLDKNREIPRDSSKRSDHSNQ